MSLPLASIPKMRRGVGFRRVGDEGVLLVAETSEAIVVNGTGTRILELVDGKRSVSEILCVLEQEFDVAPQELEAQVLTFLTRARDGKMLDVVERRP